MDAAPGSVSQVSARMQFHITGRWSAAVACCIPSQHCGLLLVALLVLIQFYRASAGSLIEGNQS